eukprot:3218217-Rhodomonas_salina.1
MRSGARPRLRRTFQQAPHKQRCNCAGLRRAAGGGTCLSGRRVPCPAAIASRTPRCMRHRDCRNRGRTQQPFHQMRLAGWLRNVLFGFVVASFVGQRVWLALVLKGGLVCWCLKLAVRHAGAVQLASAQGSRRGACWPPWTWKANGDAGLSERPSVS